MQIVDMELIEVSASYRKVLLAMIGPQLRNVRFSMCFDIDASADLLPCTKVERLSIVDSYIRPLPADSTISKESFLPRLKSLYSSSTCLHNVSHLLETPRPSLLRFYCRCLHIGIPESNSRCTLMDIPKLWPNLEELVVGFPNEGVMLGNLLKIEPIIPQLEKLKRLVLRFTAMENEEEEEQIINDLEARFRKLKCRLFVDFSFMNEISSCMYP